MRIKGLAMPWHGNRNAKALGAARDDVASGASVRLIAKIILTVSVLALPVAVWALTQGQYLPLLVSLAVAAGAGVTQASLRQGRTEHAANVLIAMTMVLGTVLSLFDANLADFGLATALLGPVLASLLGNRRTERLAWTFCVASVTITVTGGNWVAATAAGQSFGMLWASLGLYATLSVSTVLSAHRIGLRVVELERAQIDTFRHLIEHVQHAVIRLSLTGDVVSASQSGSELFGCKRYELNGRGLIDRVHVQDRPAYLTALDSTRNAKAPQTIELRMRRDGTEKSTAAPSFIWVEMSISAIMSRGESGETSGLLLLARDISHRKQQEADINAAKQAAQDASEAKSRFLANVGHELRTPLNAIVGFSDMMASEIVGPLEPGQREYAELIHRSGMHLLEIVNSLLDMSKIEAGKFELAHEPFEPDALIDPSVNMVQPMAAERGIRVRVDAPTKLDAVRGDERAYRQILINLLSNAIKFSAPNGEVTLKMYHRGPNFVMMVSDNGIGMPADVVAQLGEPFFQAQQNLTRQYEGTGLGMSIVRGLIDLHDGKLNVDSAPGKGTRMTVVMPVAGPAEPAEPEDTVHQLAKKPAVAEPVAETNRTRIAL